MQAREARVSPWAMPRAWRGAVSLITCGALLVACGASDASGGSGTDVAADPSPPAPIATDDPAGEDDLAPPQPGIYRGTYFVPVPAELEPYALFELESVRVEQRGNELGLQYDLPELLLGEARGLSFRGVADGEGTYRLEGDDGVATCRGNAGRWTCDEVLNDIELDSSKVDRLLASMPDAEARARRGVSDRFGIDPIGVLEVDLSPRP